MTNIPTKGRVLAGCAALLAGGLLADVEPLMDERWHQHEPYNQFAPVIDGQLPPCGCVATGCSQMFHYYRWPARTYGVTAAAASCTGNSLSGAFPLAVDGHEPFDYAAMENPSSVTGAYHVARFVLWCDALAKMCFQTGGSNTALYKVPSSASYWYEKGVELNPKTDGDCRERLKRELEAGRPVQTTIDGHQVVVDGWKREGDEDLFHANWGQNHASDTRWYSLSATVLGSWTVSSFWIGLAPRVLAQPAPLPAASGPSVTLSWAFPACHAANLDGFTVREYTCGGAARDVTSDLVQAISLRAADYYPVEGVYGLTESSSFSCLVDSSYTRSMALVLQMRLDGGAWQDLATPELSTRESYMDEKAGQYIDETVKATVSTNLSAYAGRMAEFRFVTRWTDDGEAAADAYICASNFVWRNVLAPNAAVERKVSAQARTLALEGLSAGYRAFTVTAVTNGVEGVVSEPVGTRVVASGEAVPAPPAIVSVSTMGSPMVNGFQRSCKSGGQVYFVQCSTNVVSLRVSNSHLRYFGNDAFRVIRCGGGAFVFYVETSGIANQSRMIYTLEATDGLGGTAYRDLEITVTNDVEEEEEANLIGSLTQPDALIVPPDAVLELPSDFDRPVVGSGTVVFRDEAPTGDTLLYSLRENWVAWQGTVRLVGCGTVNETLYQNENSRLEQVGGEEEEPVDPDAPVAVWCGDFTASAKGAWTLDANGNAATATNVMIGTGTQGVLFSRTSGVESPTVIVRYENLAYPDSDSKGYVMASAKKGGDSNRTGVAVKGTAGEGWGVWNGGCHLEAETRGAFDRARGSFGFCYKNPAFTKLRSRTSGTKYYSSILKSSGDAGAVIDGFAVGGLRGSATTAANGVTYSGCAGMVITGVAIFEKELTDQQIADYRFADEGETLDEGDPEPEQGPVPCALWDCDFGEEKANATFSANGNATAADGSYVQITKEGTSAGGARFVLDPGVATSGVATVIFKVSDIPAHEAFLVSVHNKSTETVKANDPAGVYLTPELVPTQISGGNRGSAAGTALAAGLETRKLAMTWSTAGWQLYEIADGVATQKFTCSTGHQMTFGGCTIGAAKAASSQNAIRSATGLKVLSVALFNEALTAEQLGAYAFASDVPAEAVELRHQFTFDGTMASQVGGASPKSDSATYVDGLCDRAMSFAGNSGSWYGTGLSAGTSNWTVLAVAKAPAAENQVLFSLGGKSGETGGFGLASAGDGGVKAFGWSNAAVSGTWTAAADAATSTYHFYAFAYDAENRRLKWSVDGGDYSEEVDFEYVSNGKWQIGGVHGGQVGPFVNASSGALDELRLYSGRLSKADLARVMAEFRRTKARLAYRFDFNGSIAANPGGISKGGGTYAEGICDQALSFAGNTGSWYGDSGLSAGTGDWTVLAVARAPAETDRVLFSLGGRSDANGFGLASAGNAGIKAFTWSNGGSAATVATAAAAQEDATGAYHFYVFAYDAASRKLKWSVDGGAYANEVSYTYANNAKWQIGGVHGGTVGTFANAQSGALDELRLYEGQLTQEEIARVMAEFQWPYEATVAGNVRFSELAGWTQHGVAVEAPTNLPSVRIALNGAGFVTGLADSPLTLTLGENVACDVTAATNATFSGDGQFLVRAASVTADRTFDAGLCWGLIGGATAAEQVTVSAALTVNCVPFVTYGHVKLENAAFSADNLTGSNLYVYDVKAMTGNLSLGMATLSKREYQAMPGATITLDSAGEVQVVDTYLLRNSGRAGGFYGQGTFAVAAGRTVYGGYLGIAAKPRYSGDSYRRCQYVWTDRGHVGADATLKFTVMDRTFNTYLIDMLKRFTVDRGGKIVLAKHGESEAFVTFTSPADGTRFSPEALFGTPAATRDFERDGSQTMGYQGLFTNAVRVANYGYDQAFISALVDAAHAQVADAVTNEPFAVSLYADLAALDGADILTVGDASARAIRLRVGEGLLQVCEVTGATARETGIVAARGPGFHLFTLAKTDRGVALYVDGRLVGTDFAFTGAVSGPVTIGTGASVRMFRMDDVLLSEDLVAKLARMWPVNETTTPSVLSESSILSRIRMNSAWAARHLPEGVVTNLFNHEAIKADEEITGSGEARRQDVEAYQKELEKLGANGLPLWQSYLQGFDPDDADRRHARPYVNEVRFAQDAVDSAASNTVVELSYANPDRNSGINVTYHLSARNAAGAARRNVPVLGGQATLVDDAQPMDFKPKAEIQPRLPNIIFVLADDLGYGDVGWTVQTNRAANGQIHIRTPHMDRMVAEGCELTAHYAAAPVCAPSRASILTGKHQGTCSLRDNSFDCPILEERTIGSVMKELGYVTHAVGKWGVGGGGESGLPMIAHPLDRGFDHFYGFLDHGAGHTYYHYDGLLNGAYMGILEDRERVTETAVGLYSTDLLVARAKKVLIDQVATNRLTGVERPVFMYFAINAMHGSGGDKLDASVPNKVNLHVPGRAYPAPNGKQYGVGGGADWDWLQANREPLRDRNTFIYEYAKGYGQAPSRYATTITRLDEAMEDLKQTIADLGIADNTIVIFTSDNGPTNEYGTNKDTFDSNGEFQQGKRSCMEGGLREPTFIWAPGYIPAGTKDNRPSMNHSWLQFCEEVARSNTAPQMNNEVYSEYWYSNSQIMTRIGDYVGVNTSVPSCTLDTISLDIYNVVTDPGQTKKLNDTEIGQALLPRMRELMKGYHALWQRPGGFGNGDGGKESNGRPYDAK